MAINKKIKTKLIILGVLVIVAVSIFPYVNKVNKKLEAIKWKNNNPLVVEKSKVEIDGYVKKYLFRKDRFIGTINIEGKNFVFNDNDKNSNYVFSNIMQELMFINDKGEYQQFGCIKSDSSFKNIFIAINDNKDINSSSWCITSGIIISAPAKTREQAIEIAKKANENINWLSEELE